MTSRKRACLICVDNHRVLCIELEDPVTRKRFWSVPGGQIEANEAPHQAAVRETIEETGYEAIVDPSSALITRYRFHWAGTGYDCVTHWYRGYVKTPTPNTVMNEPYITTCLWLPLNRLTDLMAPHPFIRDPIIAIASSDG